MNVKIVMFFEVEKVLCTQGIFLYSLSVKFVIYSHPLTYSIGGDRPNGINRTMTESNIHREFKLT